jgi:hypothetical protein
MAEQAMTLMGGLIDTHAEQTAEAPKTAPVREWMIRNAWALVIGSGVLFWAVIAGIFLLA